MPQPTQADEPDLQVLPFSSYAMIIDARTEKEFREDHVPGAINLPVVDQPEFAEVGTLHRSDTHTAYMVGVAYAMRRMADHVERVIKDVPPDERILVYCFRGGKRSKLWADNLRTIGFRVDTIKGGWKNYRRWVMAGLDKLVPSLRFRVIAGPTGAGKTRLLDALEAEGAQVLDLEALASHRGSLIGALPGVAQPSQKYFDTLVLDRLRSFSPARPVWVEAESKRIGAVQLSQGLFDAIHDAPIVILEAPMAERVKLWREDYGHFEADLPGMVALLAKLAPLVGNEEMALWRQLARDGKAAELFERLMTHHYDRAYARSSRKNHVDLDAAEVLELESLDEATLRASARRLIARHTKSPESTGAAATPART